MLQLTCSRCSHAGAPGHVDPGGGMVRLTCSRCDSIHVMLPDGSLALIVASAQAVSVDLPVTAPLGLPVSPAAAVPVAAVPVAAVPVAAVPVAAVPFARDAVSVLDIAVQPVDLPPVKCPKCGHRQHESESCHRCGLVFHLVKPGFAPWDDYGELAKSHLPRARELWNAVELFPASDEAHDAFVQHCRKTGLLLFAATRYRHFLSDYPGHSLTEKWLAQVVRDATAMAGVMRSQQDEFMAAAARAKTIMLVTVVSLTVLAMIALLWMMSKQQSMGPW
jgi:hypothetical protein